MLRRAPAAILLFCLISAALLVVPCAGDHLPRRGAKPTQRCSWPTSRTLSRRSADSINAIHDFSATVDMVPALGSAEKNKITEYKDVRAYILFRKPADIRIIGLYPVVRNKAFDMVSDGADFKLYIALQNRFIVGRNEIDRSRPPTSSRTCARSISWTPCWCARSIPTEQGAAREPHRRGQRLLHPPRGPRRPDGELQLDRTIWFSRVNLHMARQLIFDDAGNILTDARYSDGRPTITCRSPSTSKSTARRTNTAWCSTS